MFGYNYIDVVVFDRRDGEQKKQRNSCSPFTVSVLLLLAFLHLNSGHPALFALFYMVGQQDKRTNNSTMFPALKINAAAGYKGPVKIKLLKGADNA